MDVITNPRPDLSKTMLVKVGPGLNTPSCPSVISFGVNIMAADALAPTAPVDIRRHGIDSVEQTTCSVGKSWFNLLG